MLTIKNFVGLTIVYVSEVLLRILWRQQINWNVSKYVSAIPAGIYLNISWYSCISYLDYGKDTTCTIHEHVT